VRDVVIGAASVAAVLAVNPAAAASAAMNGTLVCKASLSPVSPARCICSAEAFTTVASGGAAADREQEYRRACGNQASRLADWGIQFAPRKRCCDCLRSSLRED
jgi:hypothetical protein